MSLADISTRIAQIQSLVAPFTSAAPTTTSATSGADFATSLSSALGQGTTSTTATTGTSGTSFSTLGTGTTSAADGDDLAAYASKFVGTPYVAGGRSPATGWDCAGFTQWVAKQYGITIPDVSWEQIKTGQPVASLSDAKAGDLLFFHEPGGHHHDPSALGVNHVAIYLGDGKMVEAANPSAGTQISPVDTAHLVGIRRIAAPNDGIPRTPDQVLGGLSGIGGISGLSSLPNLSGLSSLSSPSSYGVSGVSGASAVASVPSVRPTGELSPTQLVDVLKQAGFTGEGLHVAWAVAMRESHGRPGALGAVNSNGTRDHGLFQLNDIHMGRAIDPTQVYDAGANAAAAFRMSRHGTDFSAWGLGHTGWAGHLESAQPATYAMLNQRFQDWYARFPGA